MVKDAALFLIFFSVMCSSFTSAADVKDKDSSSPLRISLADWKPGDYTDYEVTVEKDGKVTDRYLLSRRMLKEIDFEGERRKVIEVEIKRKGKSAVTYKIMLPGNIEEIIRENPFYITNYSANFSYALRLKTKPAGFPEGEIDLMNLTDKGVLSGSLFMNMISGEDNGNKANSSVAQQGITDPKCKQYQIKESPAGFLYEEKLKDEKKNKYRLTYKEFQRTIKRCGPTNRKVLKKELPCDCYQGKVSIQTPKDLTQTTEYRVYQSEKIPLTGVVSLEVSTKNGKNSVNINMILQDYGPKSKEIKSKDK